MSSLIQSLTNFGFAIYFCYSGVSNFVVLPLRLWMFLQAPGKIIDPRSASLGCGNWRHPSPWVGLWMGQGPVFPGTGWEETGLLGRCGHSNAPSSYFLGKTDASKCGLLELFRAAPCGLTTQHLWETSRSWQVALSCHFGGVAMSMLLSAWLLGTTWCAIQGSLGYTGPLTSALWVVLMSSPTKRSWKCWYDEKVSCCLNVGNWFPQHFMDQMKCIQWLDQALPPVCIPHLRD